VKEKYAGSASTRADEPGRLNKFIQSEIAHWAKLVKPRPE
jgi:hypothetical protein